MVLLALGFIPALVFAWVFEMTPQGLRRESEIDRSASTVDHTARKLDIAVIVLLLVLDAEAVPKSKKLIRMTVDLGFEKRTILAGIKEAYAPEELVGRKIVVVANLEPRALMGVMSHGMLLAASDSSSKPYLIAPPADAQPGFIVK